MPRGRPIDDETRARIIELAKSGMGRNAIARECRVAGATVTSVTQPEGIEFDWSTTELATAARKVQVGEMRTDLAHAALVRAWDVLERMSEPHDEVTYARGRKGRAGHWVRYTHPMPSPSDQRNYATIFGILTQRAADLLRSSAGGGANADAVSVIGTLGENLSRAAEALAGTLGDESDPTAAPVILDRNDMIAALESEVGETGQNGGDDPLEE